MFFTSLCSLFILFGSFPLSAKAAGTLSSALKDYLNLQHRNLYLVTHYIKIRHLTWQVFCQLIYILKMGLHVH